MHSILRILAAVYDWLAEECKDKHKNCGANPGWPQSWCDSAHQYVLDNCPAFCGLCSECTLCSRFVRMN